MKAWGREADWCHPVHFPVIILWKFDPKNSVCITKKSLFNSDYATLEDHWSRLHPHLSSGSFLCSPSSHIKSPVSSLYLLSFFKKNFYF